MNNSLIQGSVPELNIAGTQLDALGFTGDAPVRLIHACTCAISSGAIIRLANKE